MRASLALFATLALGLAAPALADVTARYTVTPPAAAAPGGAAGAAATPAVPPAGMPVLTVSADNGGQSRLEAGAGGQSILLITREGVGYFVAPSPQGPIIGRQADMIALMTQFAGAMATGPGRAGLDHMRAARIEVAARGSETVAGVRGTVYALTFVDGANRSPPQEVVMSTDPRLAPVGREIVRLFELGRAPLVAIAGSEPQVYTAIRELLGRGTPIRMGPGFRLASVSTASVPASTFALPGPVLTAEQLLGRLMAMRPPSPPAATPAPAPTPAPPAPVPPAHDNHQPHRR